MDLSPNGIMIYLKDTSYTTPYDTTILIKDGGNNIELSGSICGHGIGHVTIEIGTNRFSDLYSVVIGTEGLTDEAVDQIGRICIEQDWLICSTQNI